MCGLCIFFRFEFIINFLSEPLPPFNVTLHQPQDGNSTTSLILEWDIDNKFFGTYTFRLVSLQGTVVQRHVSMLNMTENIFHFDNLTPGESYKILMQSVVSFSETLTKKSVLAESNFERTGNTPVFFNFVCSSR